MSAWKTIVAFLTEARRDPVEALIDYVERRYNGHEADELRKFIDGHRDDVAAVRRHVHGYFVDREADKLAAALPQPQGKAGGGQPRPTRPSSASSGGAVGNGSTDKGSGRSEPIPQRPDRAGTKANAPAPSPTVLQPGGKADQAVGSAGMHQKPQSYAMKPGVQPSSGAGAKANSPVVKPNFKGSFIGQHFAPSAYSAPDAEERKDAESELERAIDQARSAGDLGRVNLLRQRLALLQRRQGGFKKRSTMHPSGATGAMVRAGVSQNPANPRGVVLRRDGGNVSWDAEHPGWWWAGDDHGWVSKSEFASLVGAGQVKRRGA